MELTAIKTRLLDLDTAIAGGVSAETLRADLAAVVGMVDELIGAGKVSAAMQLGQLGGTVTAKRGPDYFRELAGRRKTRAGGRPRKETAIVEGHPTG